MGSISLLGISIGFFFIIGISILFFQKKYIYHNQNIEKKQDGLEQEEHKKLDASELEMIANIMAFNEKEVKDIMTHRKKIVGIPHDWSLEKAFSFMLEESYSRFPLYEENIDNIIGILHFKDVARMFMKKGEKEVSLKEVSKKPFFVPDTKRINALFHDMQISKIHMAIAIDEYGQTAGLIAMEDVLEEIVGNILDEYDVDETFLIEQGNGKYLAKGTAQLEEVFEKLSIPLEETSYDTLNGWLISLLGRIPDDGEKQTVSYQNYQFHILEVKNNMIRYIRIIKNKEEANE